MMMAQQSKKNEPVHHAHPPEGTIAWFFYEFWPIMFFGGLFVMMCALPMILIPSSASTIAAMTDPHKTIKLIRDIVLSPFALCIISAFLGAIAVTLYATRMIGLYLFLVALAAFTIIFVSFPEAITKFHITWIAIYMLGAIFVAMIFLPQRASKMSNKNVDKNQK